LFTSAQQQFQFFPVHNRHQLTPQTGTLWSQVQLDLLEVLDPQELAVQVVQEAEEEHQVPQEKAEHQEHQDQVVHQAKVDQVVLQDNLVQVEHQDLVEHQELAEQLEMLEHQEHQDLAEHLELAEQLEMLEHQEQVVHLEHRESLVQLEKPVQLGQHSSLYWSVQELQQSTHQTRFPSQLLDSM
jgi:hypothetical protein